MRIGLRALLAALLIAVAVPIISARSDSESWASTEVQLQLGDLLFAEARYREAVEAYDRAKQTAGSLQLPRAIGGLVKGLLRVAEFGRARTEASALRSGLPQDPGSIALYGDTLWAGGLFDEAEASYHEALALDPDEPNAHHGLAKALAARSQLDEAMLEARAALKLSPRDGEFHHTVGMIFQRMQKFQEAAAAFGNYLNLLPRGDRSEKARWSRSAIRFLRSFGSRVPYEIDETASEKLYTIPFRLVKDKVVTRGSVNGSGTMDFVLDTGSEQTRAVGPCGAAPGRPGARLYPECRGRRCGLAGSADWPHRRTAVWRLEDPQRALPHQEPGARGLAHARRGEFLATGDGAVGDHRLRAPRARHRTTPCLRSRSMSSYRCASTGSRPSEGRSTTRIRQASSSIQAVRSFR